LATLASLGILANYQNPLNGALYGKEALVEESQLDWNRYITHIDLYKFYFDMMVKLNVFFYGITGAILSFYFSNKANNSELEYVLLLSVFFGFGVAALAYYGYSTLKYSHEDIVNLVEKMQIKIGVQTKSLDYVMCFSAIFCSLTSIVVLYLFFSNAI
jgi:hypothetical protein